MQVYGLGSAGHVTGFSYISGNQAVHAFVYLNGAPMDLGTFGGNLSIGYAVNASGQVTGESRTLDNAQADAFLWTGAEVLDLGNLGGACRGLAINDAGAVVGSSATADYDKAGFLYTAQGMVDLGSLGGGGTDAIDINAQGSVAGDSYTAYYDSHAYLYRAGEMTDLGDLGGGYSSAYDLNDADQVVGESYTPEWQTHAFLYSGTNITDLGTLGGTRSCATRLSNTGQVIGVSMTTNDAFSHGFIWSAGVMTDLGTLGGTRTQPYAINNLGQVVGESALADNRKHAFLWQNGTLTDLNTLLPAGSGWELSSAQFINDSGRIVGQGAFNGFSQWYVLDLAGGNRPPVANAGPDQKAECATPVTLNGSGSSDPDGDALQYQWSAWGTVLSTEPVFTATFPLGTNVVTLRVTDPSGEFAEAAVTVTVADTLPPVVTGPATLSAEADANCQGAVPNVAAQVTAGDACTAPESLVISQEPAAGTLVDLGPHAVKVTVTDASGNNSTFQTLFTVQDKTAPVLQTVSASPSQLMFQNKSLVPVTLTVVASDNCDAAAKSIIQSVTCNEPVAAGDIQVTGELTVNLAATRNPGSSGRIYTITVQCTDSAGNSSTGITTVSVIKGNGKGKL